MNLGMGKQVVEDWDADQCLLIKTLEMTSAIIGRLYVTKSPSV